MNVIDSHMHSSFSPDSQAEPVTMIRQALRDHFSHICFTDHMEYNHAEEQFELDVPAYIAALRRLKERYAKKIELHIGVELGLEPWLADSFHKHIFPLLSISILLILSLDLCMWPMDWIPAIRNFFRAGRKKKLMKPISRRSMIIFRPFVNLISWAIWTM